MERKLEILGLERQSRWSCTNSQKPKDYTSTERANGLFVHLLGRALLMLLEIQVSRFSMVVVGQVATFVLLDHKYWNCLLGRQ